MRLSFGKYKGMEISEVTDYSYLCHIAHYRKANFAEGELKSIQEQIYNLIDERNIKNGFAYRNENGEIICTTPSELQKKAEQEIEEKLLLKWNCY